MAATACAAIASLYNTLGFIDDHPRHCFYFEREQIVPLLESLEFLIIFMYHSDKSHGALDSRIARAAQAAEDVIESHVVDQIRRGSTLGGLRSNWLLHKALIKHEYIFYNYGMTDESIIKSQELDLHFRRTFSVGKRSYRFLLDLQKAIEDMNYVCRKAAKFSQSPSVLNAEQPTSSTSSSTSLALEKNKMVGFDDQVARLLDLLTGEPSSRQVISIAGMAGIGKTTLAENVFQHPYIKHHFDVRLWVTISQNFSVSKLLYDLLSQTKEKNFHQNKKQKASPPSSVDELGDELRKSLYGRRYLIILDDMWNVEAWDELKFYFPDRNDGNRIVVTTRQLNVAQYLHDSHFDMGLLDEENSWDLFCQKTFEGQGCPPELEEIGRKILQKCGGLPLAIVVVGGHLRKSSRNTEYWENVAKDMNSVFNSEENEWCMNILSLSYKYLPNFLKPCFLSLGVFIENQEIPYSDIFSLWMGEGFLLSIPIPKTTIERAACHCMMELYERNLISLQLKSWVNGRRIVCRVHDLLKKLCMNIAKKEEFLSALDSRRTINKDRRVVMKRKIPEVNHQPQLIAAPKSAVVRSLICEGGQLSFDLKLLRVLDKVDVTLGTQINIQQVNLRYLKVAVVNKGQLPSSVSSSISSSISQLWNLQKLIITGDHGPIIAPYEIWEMPHLQHIEVDQLCLPHPLPAEDMDEDSVLKHWRTLSKVENFMLSEEVCRRIPNINVLELSYKGEPSLDYCPHNLGCFQKLKRLECYFDSNTMWHDFASRLTFPDSLKKLHLTNCRLDWDDLRTVGFLPHLEFLGLFENSVSGSTWSPVEGGFPSLEILTISFCDLIYWNADDIHFPKLEEVYLERLDGLDEFPLGIGEIPTLRSVILLHCSMSLSLSAMRMAVEQEEDLGNEELQLGVYFDGDKETLVVFLEKVLEEGLMMNNNTYLVV